MSTKSNAYQAAKNLLLQEQKGDINQEELIDDIVMGRSSLLTTNDIASRLAVPIDEFHQWVKNTDPKYKIPPSSMFGAIGNAITNSALNRTEQHKFAKPDFYIGSYPRWKVETLRNWLRNNLK